MGNLNKIDEQNKKSSLENLSDEQLVDLKNQAIADEDYDKAKEIKQEQERRKMQGIEDEKKTYKIQKEEKLKSLTDSFQQSEDEEKLWDTIDISNEEIDALTDLFWRMTQMNWRFDYQKKYEAFSNQLASLQYMDTRNRFFIRHNILSKADFQEYILRTFYQMVTDIKYLRWNYNREEVWKVRDCLKTYANKYLNYKDDNECNHLYFQIDTVLKKLSDRAKQRDE